MFSSVSQQCRGVYYRRVQLHNREKETSLPAPALHVVRKGAVAFQGQTVWTAVQHLHSSPRALLLNKKAFSLNISILLSALLYLPLHKHL